MGGFRSFGRRDTTEVAPLADVRQFERKVARDHAGWGKAAPSGAAKIFARPLLFPSRGARYAASDFEPFLANVRRRLESRRRASVDNLTVAHHIKPIADFQGDRKLLLDQQNGDAAFCDFL